MKLLLTILIASQLSACASLYMSPEEIAAQEQQELDNQRYAQKRKEQAIQRPLQLNDLQVGYTRESLEDLIGHSQDEYRRPDGSMAVAYDNGQRPMILVYDGNNELVSWDINREKLEAIAEQQRAQDEYDRRRSQAWANAFASAGESFRQPAYQPKKRTVCRNVVGNVICEEQ